MTDAPQLDAFLSAQRLAGDYELSDLSPQEINRMSMSDYAKVRERAGLDPIDPFATAYAAYEPEHQDQDQDQEHPPAPAQEPQQPNPLSMGWQEYAQWREASGLAARSAEGMSRAEVHLTGRMERRNIPPAGRTAWYSGS